MIHVGIDPGVHGAICILRNNVCDVVALDSSFEVALLHDTAVVVAANKVKRLQEETGETVHVMIEHPFCCAGHGTAPAKLYRSFGYITAKFDCLYIMHQVAPRNWQKTAGVKKIKKSKSAEYARACEIFGKGIVDKMSTIIGKSGRPLKNKHDGVIDAMLLAHVCRMGCEE